MSSPTAVSGIRGTAADIWEHYGAAACRREGCSSARFKGGDVQLIPCAHLV